MSLCETCPALCCMNVNILLSPKEVLFLRSKRTDLSETEPPRHLMCQEVDLFVHYSESYVHNLIILSKEDIII